jgi:tRNA threonylcarbamoyladenosine biosynthesis protein TsaE
MKEFVVGGADEMRALGARLAQALLRAPRDQSVLVTLSGELGAGKTTLVGGLLAELGHVGPVRSPTYTLLEPYRLQGRDITHCDLYRLRHPDELDDLGLRDLRGADSVLLVEWPEKAESRLGAADLALTFDYAGPDARKLVVEARSTAGRAILGRL